MIKKRFRGYRICSKNIITIIFLFFQLFFVECLVAKKYVEQYTFDEFVELIGLKKGDSHLKSVVKNKNYKFKYTKKNRSWKSKKKGVKIEHDENNIVDKIILSGSSYGEKYTGDLPNSCTSENILDSFDWYRSKKLKYYTCYKKDYLITLLANERYNGTKIYGFEIKKMDIDWVEKPALRDCNCDDTPPDELTGDFKGDKILDYVGRHESNPIVKSLLVDSSLNFENKGNGDYVSKNRSVIIKFSDDYNVKSITIKKGFNRLVPGNIEYKNLLSCRNWEYTRGYNYSEVNYKGYLLSIYRSMNNDIEKLVITPAAYNAKKDKQLIAKQKYKDTKVEGDLLMNLIGESIYDDFVDYLFDEYNFAKDKNQFESKALGLTLITDSKTNRIDKVLMVNTQEQQFEGKLPYNLKFDSFFTSSNLNFMKIDDYYAATKDNYLFIASTSDGNEADYCMIQKAPQSKTVAKKKETYSKKTTPQKIEHLIRELASSLSVEGWYLVTKKLDNSIKGVNNYYSSVEFGSWSNNLYVIQIIYQRKSVSVKKLKVNDVVINMESKDTMEGYQVELYPVNSSNDGKVKVSANLSFKDAEETDYAIVVYRKPISKR